MMSISIPYLPDDILRYAATKFLKEYHTSGTIPVPIEQIVEFQLGINIIPIPDIHRNYDIDSMLSKDLRQICVDESVFENFPGRYRFSLAHEIGHRVLHAEIYSQLQFADMASWKDAICTAIDEKDYGKLEFQAYAFAGLILVPPTALDERLHAACALAASKGLKIDTDSDVAKNMVEGYLSKEFVVSRAVIQRRLANDKLWTTPL
jgi:Zn-dependent peptidase ImmA (M78 family)